MRGIVMMSRDKSASLLDKLKGMKEDIQDLIECVEENMMNERSGMRYREEDDDMDYRMGRRGGGTTSGYRRGR